MPAAMTRRTALAGCAFAHFGLLSSEFAYAAPTTDPGAELAALERRSGGRLGVAALDLGTNTRIAHRADERFPMCSTFKFLAAACVLARADAGQERLDRRVVFGPADLVTYSPITEKRVGGDGMSMAEICEAAMILSDNTAGNLMLATFGGPAGLTAYVRSLGDEITRLDRIETDLNEATPGDPRDTTTPGAMLENIRRIVLGDALSPKARDQITTWLVANRTGDTRIRAGVPKDWRVGDKTGTGGNGANNDVGVLWPPDRAPTILTVYLAEAPGPLEARNAIVAEAARIVAGSV